MNDPSELARQLGEDQVAFANLPDDPVLQDQLTEVLDDATGIIVVPGSDRTSADLRDLAQDVLDVSGLTTVIVRSPDSSAAVSDVYSRSALEGSQMLLAQQPDYVVGVREFLAHLDASGPPWMAVGLVAAVALAAVSLWAAFSVRSMDLTVRNRGETSSV